MLEKLKKIKEKYDELTDMIVKPEVIANNEEWQKLVKERNSIEEIAEMYDKLLKCTKELEDAKKEIESETDVDMKNLFQEEIKNKSDELEKLNEEAKVLLLPKDQNDEKNVIIEIRPGVGGDEAGLFAGDLMNMYMRYAERNKWKVEIIDLSQGEMGGIKQTTFMVNGKNAYSKLKFESGVHRVQRVPETETQGRIHTSTATVAVLPEMEKTELNIDEKDLRIDTFRSSGAGGQKVNKTDSAIRITHIPTGIVVECQDERYQVKNKEKAMKVMMSKLYDYYQGIKDKEYAENRRVQIGNGDRSEKIRTYNFPQSRVTDHRINFTTYNLEGFMDGDMDEMINELVMADQKAKLEKFSV
jgi:peptide chain release factor 1